MLRLAAMAARSLCRIWLCSLLALLAPGGLAGVTVITHGFNADIDDWVIAMAGAVTRYPALGGSNTVCYEIYFERNSEGAYQPRQRKLDGGEPRGADSGEIIIKLNWSPLAGGLQGVSYSTTEVAPAVASTLAAPGFIPELGGGPLAELPLHLIGHSRGGSLLCEVAKLLGQDGIWVDHLTTIDPHPLNNDYDDSLLTDIVDAPSVPYVNVLFADNYFQVNNSFLGLDPSGQYVPGAYNRLLDVRSGGYGGIAADHSNTHLWYHGTIDWSTPSSDGAATITSLERMAWWTPAESNGVTAGFHYSRLGGGDRLSEAAPAGGTNQLRNGYNQIWDLGAGVSPNRFALPENNGLWPNLLTFAATPSNTPPPAGEPDPVAIEAGAVLPVVWQYQAGHLGGNSLIFQVFLDEDSNPYSTNQILLQTIELEPTGINAVGTLSAAITGTEMAAPGVYTLGASITDGTRTRYLYAPQGVRILPGTQPVQFTLARAEAGFFEGRVGGTIGQTIIIEASPDFQEWTVVKTVTLSGPVWEFRDSIPDGAEARFYRARVMP